MVSAEATIFTKTVRIRTPRGLWCTAAIAASVPWPSASGATAKTRIAPARAPTLAMSGMAHGRAKCDDASLPPSLAGSGTR